MIRKCIGMFIVLFLVSCGQDKKLLELEARILDIEEKNEMLSDSLYRLENQFIKPFKLYEANVLSEFKKAPSQSIEDYEKLIKENPNSFWKHEAKKRIENIKLRSKYWSKEKGWELPKKTVYNKPPPPPPIFCPGC